MDISSSKISQDGGVALAESLTENKNLTTLKLHDNFLSEIAGRQIAELLEDNNKLLIIDLGGNQLNHSTIKKIKTICQRNRSLKKVKKIICRLLTKHRV